MTEMPVPPKGTVMQTRAPAAAASESPEVDEAIQVMIGAVGTALFEMLGDAGDDAEMMLDQSLHTDFHNDLRDFIDEWMNTYMEAHERGDFE